MMSKLSKTGELASKQGDIKIPFYDVFISYSHSDSKLAKKIAQDISEFGFDVFFDEWSIPYGQDIPSTVEFALEKSNKILAIISTEALESEWATFERRYNWTDIYLRNKNKLIPIISKKIDLPENISRLKYLDFTKGSYSKNIKKLRDGIIAFASNLKFGQYQVENLYHGLQYIDFVISKIIFYFPGHKIEVIKMAYEELVNNAFEHVKNPIISVGINATKKYIELNVKDNGKGFDILETLIENYNLLRENPSRDKKRGLILLDKNCDYLGNSISETSHTINIIINKLSKREYFEHVDGYKELFYSKSVIANYISPSKKISFSRVNVRLIDIPAAESMRKAIHQIINPNIKKYLLDLSYIYSIGSSGVGTLLRFAKELTDMGAILSVVVTASEVVALFKIIKLNKLLNVFDSVDKAKEFLLTQKTKTGKGTG